MGIEHMKHLKFFVFLCILTFAVSCGQQKRYIQYRVKKGETMSKIAQKLEMKKKDLIRLNPDIDSEPKANSFIVVPEKNLSLLNQKIEGRKEDINEVTLDSSDINGLNKLDTELDIADELNKKYVIYEVKKGDTFYNINKRFDVTRGELLLLNPDLKEGLKLGQLLKIREIIVELVNEDVFYDDYINYGTNLKVALLLPFRTSNYRSDTLTLKEIFFGSGALVNIATDFYLGAEIAVDSLRSKGIDIELNVYDTGDRRRNDIMNIISNKDLNSNNVVIGPLYSEEVQTVAANVNIPVIFPVYSKNQSEFASANIVKTSPNKKVFSEELVRYIKDNFDEGTITIVTDEKSKSLQAARDLQSSLEFRTGVVGVDILTPTGGYIKKSRFLQILKPNVKNWVIMATDKDLIIKDAINSLISLPAETTAKILTYDKASVYNEVDNRKLAKLGFTYVSDEFVDENSLSSRVFNKQYMKKNNALPSFYATKGFDITYDILIRLASGKDLQSTLKEGMSSRVDTKFDYRNSQYLAENQGLFIVQYNEDLSLTKLK
jgi:LysM repeat protein